MKLLLLLIFFSSLSLAQTSIEDLTKLNPTQVVQLDIESSNTVKLIKSDFSKEDLISVENLIDLTPVKVYYIYTRFKENPEFNQIELNRKRFTRLYTAYPQLFEDQFVEWEVVEQTGCDRKEMGKNYFHGFVVVHRPIDTPENRIEEIKKLEAFFFGDMDKYSEELLDPIQNQLEPSKNDNPIPDKKINSKNGFAEFPEGEDALYEHFQNTLNVAGDITINREDHWVPCLLSFSAAGKLDSIEFQSSLTPEHIQNVVRKSLEEMPIWIPAARNGESVSSRTQLDIRVCYDRALNGIYFRDGRAPKINLDRIKEPVVKPSPTEMIIEMESAKVQSPLQENALYKGMEVVQSGKQMAVVMDVTGSMATYVATLGIWLKKNPGKLNISSYSFFNDGDTKRSTEKVIGRTGGIYTTDTSALIVETIVHAMRMGGGGEPSESDIEAILHAIQIDPTAESILFIGDNYSEIRDLSLLPQVNKPVDVLLCAVKNTVNTSYLEIAKKTGGLLIIENKSYDLSLLQKGDGIKIGEREYKYKGDKFVLQKD